MAAVGNKLISNDDDTRDPPLGLMLSPCAGLAVADKDAGGEETAVVSVPPRWLWIPTLGCRFVAMLRRMILM